MRNHNESYDRYRQGDAQRAEELAERQRATEEALKWESHRQWLRECGTLDTVESNFRDFHRLWIKIERQCGKSRRDAEHYADARIADFRWVLMTDSPVDTAVRRMHAWRKLGQYSMTMRGVRAGGKLETSAHTPSGVELEVD